MQSKTNKHYYEVGWRLSKAQREAIKAMGYYVYSTRSWDEGCGSTLEHFVLVNHESDVIMDFEALDSNDKNAYINDFYKFLDKNNVEYDSTIGESLKTILED